MNRRPVPTRAPYAGADVGAMRHYRTMPAQLVLRGESRDSATFDLVRNDAGHPPDSFEDVEHGVRVPRFGGAAILRAAAEALAHGFVVRRFEFRGTGPYVTAGEISEDDVSAEVVYALEHSGVDGAQGVLHNKYRSFIIDGVVVFSFSTRVVTLRRNGVLLGADDAALRRFVHDVLEERADA